MEGRCRLYQLDGTASGEYKMSFDSERTAICYYWATCSAPLCPVFNMKGVWYADEKICTMRKSNQHLTEEGVQMIKIQKRIKKMHAKRPVTGNFTAKELINMKQIRSGIHGHDPDGVEKGPRNR